MCNQCLLDLSQSLPSHTCATCSECNEAEQSEMKTVSLAFTIQQQIAPPQCFSSLDALSITHYRTAARVQVLVLSMARKTTPENETLFCALNISFLFLSIFPLYYVLFPPFPCHSLQDVILNEVSEYQHVSAPLEDLAAVAYQILTSASLSIGEGEPVPLLEAVVEAVGPLLLYHKATEWIAVPAAS